MKITNIDATQPIAANSPPDWRTTCGQILVVIETDTDLTGYGVGGGGIAGIHVVNTVLRDLLLNRNPVSVEQLWDEMYAATLAFGRKGLAIMAISGVDLALWDLRGKAAGVPVAKCLGSPYANARIGQPLPTYRTVWGDLPPEDVAEYTAFKLHIPYRPPAERVDETVRAVSAARSLIGPDCPLMIDVWMRWDIASTLEVATALQRYNVDWIEEPLSPDDLAGYAELAEKSPIPIAGGEHEFTAIGFEPLISQRLHHVLQPDVCWCGGMTELVKIYHAAQSAGLRVCPHRGAEVWALHAIAALDANPLAESGRPWMTWVGNQPLIEHAHITLPDTPGFGVEFA